LGATGVRGPPGRRIDEIDTDTGADNDCKYVGKYYQVAHENMTVISSKL